MRGKLSTLAASTLLAVSLVAGGAAPSAHATVVTKIVKMTNSLTFNPTPITIHKGDRIKWKNTSASGTKHTAQSGVFNSGTLLPGQTYVHKFGTVGTFKYYCKYHKSFGMVGKVIVKP